MTTTIEEAANLPPPLLGNIINYLSLSEAAVLSLCFSEPQILAQIESFRTVCRLETAAEADILQSQLQTFSVGRARFPTMIVHLDLGRHADDEMLSHLAQFAPALESLAMVGSGAITAQGMAHLGNSSGSALKELQYIDVTFCRNITFRDTLALRQTTLHRGDDAVIRRQPAWMDGVEWRDQECALYYYPDGSFFWDHREERWPGYISWMRQVNNNPRQLQLEYRPTGVPNDRLAGVHPDAARFGNRHSGFVLLLEDGTIARCFGGCPPHHSVDLTSIPVGETRRFLRSGMPVSPGREDFVHGCIVVMRAKLQPHSMPSLSTPSHLLDTYRALELFNSDLQQKQQQSPQRRTSATTSCGTKDSDSSTSSKNSHQNHIEILRELTSDERLKAIGTKEDIRHLLDSCSRLCLGAEKDLGKALRERFIELGKIPQDKSFFAEVRAFHWFLNQSSKTDDKFPCDLLRDLTFALFHLVKKLAGKQQPPCALDCQFAVFLVRAIIGGSRDSDYYKGICNQTGLPFSEMTDDSFECNMVIVQSLLGDSNAETTRRVVREVSSFYESNWTKADQTQHADILKQRLEMHLCPNAYQLIPAPVDPSHFDREVPLQSLVRNPVVHSLLVRIHEKDAPAEDAPEHVKARHTRLGEALDLPLENNNAAAGLHCLLNQFTGLLGGLLGFGTSGWVIGAGEKDEYALKLMVLSPDEYFDLFAVAHSTTSKIDSPHVLKSLRWSVEELPDGNLLVIILMDQGFGTLRDAMNSNRQPNSLEIIDIMDQLLGALEAMATTKFMHGDMKPKNMIGFRNCNGTVSYKAADHQSGSLDDGNVNPLAWTEGYAAPEVKFPGRNLGKVTSNCDIYSIGVILFELLAGEKLGYNEEQLKWKFCQLEKANEEDPQRLRLIALCRKMLLWNPVERVNLRGSRTALKEAATVPKAGAAAAAAVAGKVFPQKISHSSESSSESCTVPRKGAGAAKARYSVSSGSEACTMPRKDQRRKKGSSMHGDGDDGNSFNDGEVTARDDESIDNDDDDGALSTDDDGDDELNAAANYNVSAATYNVSTLSPNSQALTHQANSMGTMANTIAEQQGAPQPSSSNQPTPPPQQQQGPNMGPHGLSGGAPISCNQPRAPAGPPAPARMDNSAAGAGVSGGAPISRNQPWAPAGPTAPAHMDNSAAGAGVAGLLKRRRLE